MTQAVEPADSVGGDSHAGVVIDGQHGEPIDVVGLVQLVRQLQAKDAMLGGSKIEIVEVGSCQSPDNGPAEGARIEAPLLPIPAVDQRTGREGTVHEGSR